MSTMFQGFSQFFSFFVTFCIGRISLFTSSIRVMIEMIINGTGLALPVDIFCSFVLISFVEYEKDGKAKSEKFIHQSVQNILLPIWQSTQLSEKSNNQQSNKVSPKKKIGCFLLPHLPYYFGPTLNIYMTI